jgi:putative endonuclease
MCAILPTWQNDQQASAKIELLVLKKRKKDWPQNTLEKQNLKREDSSCGNPHQSMIYSVYILQCADTSLYVGCTNDLEKRLHEHNHAKNGAHYTKIRRPVTLKYFERFKTLAKARAREAEIKRWKRSEKIQLLSSKTKVSL